MFTPQAVWARTFLRPLKNPPRSISWRASDSYVSCDGRTAVNTGPWFTQDARLAGYFTTVWQRTKGDWRWVYDGGVQTPVKRGTATTPRVHLATCTGHPRGAPIAAPPSLTGNEAPATPMDAGRGESADNTLGWDWTVTRSGTRTLRVFQWSNGRYAEVVHAVDPAAKPK
jgi:hypothetical protein